MAKKDKSMKTLLDELQLSLQTLSNEHLSMEDSIKEYTKSADLIEKCYQGLAGAKLQVQEIDERLADLEEQHGF